MITMKEIYRGTFFLIFALIIQIFPFNWLAGQNTGPVAPEAMSFEPVDATDMVNLLTGDFSYVLPLLEIPSPEGGFPIALSYHGGITMDQEASWVGLGWTINPGAINRGVNGIADDVKDAKIRNILYDSGEEVNSYYLSVGANGLSFTCSWGDYRSFNWGVSVGFNIAGDQFKLGVNIGNNSSGVGLYTNEMVSLGVGVQYDYSSGGLNTDVGVACSSLGISFNTKNSNFALNGPMGSVSFAQNAPSENNFYSNVQDGFEIMQIYVSPWGEYDVHFRWLKELYSFYQKIDTYYSGSLYLEYARNPLNPPYDHIQTKGNSMDSYVTYHEKTNDFESVKNCLMFPAYDSYSVSAQGLGGTMSPRYFDFGGLAGHGRILTRYDIDNDYKSDREFEYNFRTGIEEMFPKTLDSLHFYFDYEHSSYLEVSTGDYSHTGINHDPIWDYTSSGGNLETEVAIDGALKSKYVSNNYRVHRKGSGKFIEWITNEDIYNEEKLVERGFIETPSITDLDEYGKRDIEHYFDPNGIGAINITTEDGKTYHYSLPIYQFERFVYDIDLSLSIDGRIVSFDQEERNKYAYTWLLTAITGPDFIDNGDRIIDENDYGYWVRFDYGKWTDGYIWKIPFDGLKKYIDVNGHEKGTYSWGRKQIYYLNNITTRTHTAYFIKNERTDGYGFSGNLGHGFRQSGAERWGMVTNYTSQEFKLDGTIFHPCEGGDLPFFGAYIVKNFLNKTFTSQHCHKVLKLDKIILVNNKDANLSMNQSDFFITSGPIYNQGVQLGRQVELTLTNGQIAGPYCTSPEELGDFYIYYKDYIYDINDLTGSNIEQNAVRIIEFNNGYLSWLGTPNTEGGNSGKLTLNEVLILGKGGERINPPYTFRYIENQLCNYDINRIDDWGFDKNYPDNWSLEEIITPIGSKINIEYEPDEFSKVAVARDLFLNSYLSPVIACNNDDYNMLVSHQDRNLSNIFQSGDSFKITSAIEIGSEIDGEDCDREYETIESDHTIVSFEDNMFTFLPSLKEALNLYNSGGGSGNICDYRKYHYSTFNFSQTKIQIPEGGLRVKKISIVDEFNNSYSTNYNYCDPQTGISSGITSYAPLKTEIFIPYVQEIPSPGVMYEFIKVENLGADESNEGYNMYHFEVLESCTGYGDSQIQFGNQFEVVDHQPSQILFECGDGPNQIPCDDPHLRYYINARNSSIIDKTSSIGRLKENSSFNSFGQLLSNVQYNYKEFGVDEVGQGVTRESFRYRKSYHHWSDSHFDSWNTWFLNSSSKIKYPNVLESMTTYTNGYSNTVTNQSFDFITGQVLSSIVLKPNGELIKNTTIPAYSAYSGMGSKIDDTEEVKHSNMLTQSAAQYSYLLDESMNEIGTIAGNVQIWDNTWNYREFDEDDGLYYDGDEVQDIWRKQNNYSWKGSLNENGTFSSFEEFDFSEPITYNEENGWTKSGEIIRYNHYSMPIESKDINDNYTASKLGYHDPITNANEKFIIANSSNARYTEYAYSGAEDELNASRYFGGEVNCPTGSVIENVDFSHTGRNAVLAEGGQIGFKYTYLLDTPYNYYYDFNKNYIAEVWVYNNENLDFARLGYKFYDDNVVIFESDNVIDNAEIKFVAGNWRLLSVTIPTDIQLSSINLSDANRVEIAVWNSASANCPIYFDDFRVYPIKAEVSAYVYDDLTGSLTAIIDKDNIASLFDYDAMGRLIKTRSETGNGMKLTSENKYNFSRQYEYSACFNYYPTIVALGNPITFTPSDASLDSYNWKFGLDEPYYSQNLGGIEEYTFENYGEYIVNLKIEDDGHSGIYSKLIEIKEPVTSLSISPPNAIMIMKSYTVINCETALPWQKKTFIITNTGNTTIADGIVQLNSEPIFEFCPNSPTNFSLFPGQSIEISVYLYAPEPGGNDPPCELCIGTIDVYGYIESEMILLDQATIHANIIIEDE